MVTFSVTYVNSPTHRVEVTLTFQIKTSKIGGPADGLTNTSLLACLYTCLLLDYILV